MEAGDRKLKEWRISFTQASFGVLVEGYLENDPAKQLWRTSKIKHRESSRILCTKNGQRYILVGGINKIAALEKNFPSDVINRFSHGFPADWQSILYKYYFKITEGSISSNSRAICYPEESSNSRAICYSEESRAMPPPPPPIRNSSFSDDFFNDSNVFSEVDLQETGNTPIRASKHTTQRLQKKILSSSEDEEDQIHQVREKAKKRKNRPGVSPKPIVPSKKSKNRAQPGGLALRKLRENFHEESPDIEVEMVVEHPESDTSSNATLNKENNVIKRWTHAEKQRLLERLKAMNPVKESDWENVQRSKTDVFRSIDELKNKAKELNWKPRNMQGERVNLEETNTVTIKEITARPGTVDYMMQVEQANREYVAGKNKTLKNVSNLHPVSAPLQLDDSIISMIRTPENPKRVRYPFQPVPRAYNSFTSDKNSTLDESNVSAISTTSNSFMEQDEKAQKRHQKNNIQILKKHVGRRPNTHQMSITYSMADESETLQSLFAPPNVPMPSHNFSTLEEEYEDEEFEDNCEN